MESNEEDLKRAIALSLEDCSSLESGTAASNQLNNPRPLLRREEEDEGLKAAIALSLKPDAESDVSGSRSRSVIIDITSDDDNDQDGDPVCNS